MHSITGKEKIIIHDKRFMIYPIVLQCNIHHYLACNLACLSFLTDNAQLPVTIDDLPDRYHDNAVWLPSVSNSNSECDSAIAIQLCGKAVYSVEYYNSKHFVSQKYISKLVNKFMNYLKHMSGMILEYTMWYHYKAVNFLININKRHPITRPLGQGMGCFLWIQHLIDILPWFL